MSKSRKVLPYIIISFVSIAIIAAAFFVVPMVMDSLNNGGGAGLPPAIDNGDSAFISSLGGVSETYVGAVSQHSYSSINEAAEAYVNNEVAGYASSSVVSAETLQVFAPSEVDITIPNEFLENADSIEKVNVVYNVYNATTYSSAQSSNSTQYTTVVYIIKYDYMFKYFVPMPITGETISKSYYDSVFNSEKFENCTMSTSMDASISAGSSYGGETMSMTMEMKITQDVQYDNGKIYLKQYSYTSTKMTYAGQTESEVDEETIYAYITTDDYGYTVCYIKYNENDPWQRGYLYTIGFSSVEELTPFYGDYLDYTYFSKTSYGFALEKENAKQYFAQAFDSLGSSVAGVDFGEDGINMVARYYVQEGVLTGTQVNATINATVSESGQEADMAVTVTGVTTCSNYGTTVVDIDVNN